MIRPQRCNASKYRVFAALHEDTDKGWVWLSLREEGFRSRQTIKISNTEGSVYCEYRELDENFVRRYDGSDGTTSVYFGTEATEHSKQKELAKAAIRERKQLDREAVKDVVVMSDWYRKALGGLETYSRTRRVQQLTICKSRCGLWADLRAACQHPEPGVRAATRVAILGTWLGVVALLLALAEAEPAERLLERTIRYPSLGVLGLAVVLAVLGWRSARGIKP